MDETIKNSMYDRSSEHYARVLVDLDFTIKTREKNLVERKSFAFYGNSNMRIYRICDHYKIVCHNVSSCLRTCRNNLNSEPNSRKPRKHDQTKIYVANDVNLFRVDG